MIYSPSLVAQTVGGEPRAQMDNAIPGPMRLVSGIARSASTWHADGMYLNPNPKLETLVHAFNRRPAAEESAGGGQ